VRDQDRRRAEEGLAQARAALGRPAGPPSAEIPEDHDTVTNDRWSTSEFTARMAEGARRDELATRVTALEREVEQLRAENEQLRGALAEVASFDTRALAPPKEDIGRDVDKR
jgi:hypothetical protein